MLTPQPAHPIGTNLKRAATVPVLAISVLVTLAIAAAALSIRGSSGTTAVSTPRAAHPYYPLIQYRGTGATPVRSATRVASRYLRAEHSYGAVP